VLLCIASVLIRTILLSFALSRSYTRTHTHTHTLSIYD
jgi:hypothetical protein